MATIKSYSDLQQSKKLAEILPIESVDMYYNLAESKIPNFIVGSHSDYRCYIPCWSLAALLSIASTYCNRLEITLRTNKKYNVFAVKGDFVFRSFDKCSDGYDDLVDACYEMILKLHELKML